MRKLTPRELRILEFMQNCPTGITTTECLALFGTTELRKTASNFREHGYLVRTVKEKNVKNPGWHNRYFVDGVIDESRI